MRTDWSIRRPRKEPKRPPWRTHSEDMYRDASQGKAICTCSLCFLEMQRRFEE